MKRLRRKKNEEEKEEVQGRLGFRLTSSRQGMGLIGPQSCLLFDLLHVDGAWLNTPPGQWETNPQYAVMLLLVEKLAIVNNAAERGVKDIQHYANAARDGSCRERIVLVSNSHCIKIPKFLKNEN